MSDTREYGHLADLARRAAEGHMAFGPVTVSEGQQLLALLEEHAAQAAEVERLNAALLDVYEAAGGLLKVYEHTEAILIIRERLLSHFGSDVESE